MLGGRGLGREEELRKQGGAQLTGLTGIGTREK